MAVNLTKPPVMREYTPVHLMDEEESILRNSRGVEVPSSAIEVVVHTDAENAPAVAQKKKKKALNRHKNTLFVEYILPALLRAIFPCGAMALGIFLPQIVEWSVSWLPPTYADETTWLVGLVTSIQPLFMLLAFLGGVTFFIGLLYRITE